MKKRLIIPKSDEPTIVDLDAIDKDIFKESLIKEKLRRLGRRENLRELGDPREELFSLVVRTYIKEQAKEFYFSPQADSCYHMSLLMEDGSKQELVPPPRYFFREFLKSFKDWKIMRYDPYSDKEQTEIFNARYKGKDNLLELCVRQSKYGREIVIRKSGKEAVKEAV